MKNNLAQRQSDLKKRIEIFLNLKENAVKLIQAMDEVDKKHQKGGAEKQFRMLITSLRENGIWEERIDFDVKPNLYQLEVDKHLFIEELEHKDYYGLNFEENRSAGNGKISKFIVSEENEDFISIFDEKSCLEVNLGKFSRGEDFREEVNDLRGYLLRKCEEVEKMGGNLDDVCSKFEITTPLRNYSIHEYSQKILNELDLSYFIGKDALKRIVGLYVLTKGQDGDFQVKAKIKSILRGYFNGVANKFIKEQLPEKFKSGVILDDTQIFLLETATDTIMEKVLFGNNFKKLNYFLELDKENELALKAEQSINKKIMLRLVENFKGGFLEHLKKVDYEDKKLKIALDYKFFEKGGLKFEDIENDITKTCLPILSAGLSPIEAIGCFFNQGMLKKPDYFKRLVYSFKSELENWLNHKSNPLELIKEKEKEISLDKETNFSGNNGLKLKDTLGREDGVLNEKITKSDLFLIKKKIIKKAETNFQKKKIKRDFKILKLNYEGYSDEEIGEKFGMGKRAVFKTRKLLAEKIKKELYS